VTTHAIFALSIFIVAYILIITERIHRAKIAILGASLLVVFHILSQKEAFEFIDFNTIGLLSGMMILVSIVKETGVFSYIAIKIAKKTKGDSWLILLSFSLFTAFASALLDNVTTVLLIAPITILIAEMLDISPMPFLIAEILASNIGGTATLIGDPPNILIGSATELSFLDFVFHLTPVIIVILFSTLILLKIIFRKELRRSRRGYDETLREMDETKAIKDWKLLKKSVIVLSITMAGFIVHDFLDLKPATIALAGAGILLIWSDTDIEERLQEIEWPTLFFFMGLFVLVGGLEKVGILERLASGILNMTDNVALLSIAILWGSAIASSFLDNIPFVTAMIPLILKISSSLYPNVSGMDEVAYHTYLIQQSLPLWWSLSLGACLGGNGTIIGASANVVIAGFSEKTRSPLNFRNYLRYGFPMMLFSIILSTLYIFIRYLSG